MLEIYLCILSFRQAWQKLGAMPPEEAMEKYIDIVTALYPSWVAGLTLVSLMIIPFYHLAVYLSIMCVYLLCVLFPLLLSSLAQQMETRRTNVEMVMQLVVVIPKDQWDQFSALLFMRRIPEMICNVLNN